jgi:hypothetical protein
VQRVFRNGGPSSRPLDENGGSVPSDSLILEEDMARMDLERSSSGGGYMIVEPYQFESDLISDEASLSQ